VPAIAIVDDHELIAETLRVALNQAGIDARCVRPRELDDVHAELLELRPTLVLLDLDLGSFGDTTPLIAPLVASGIRVLLVTGVVDRLRVAAALEQGAIGYAAKMGDFAGLLAKTQAALRSAEVLDPAERLRLLEELWLGRARRARELEPFERLTEREADVLRAVAKGRTVTQIAREWVVSEATVRSHVRGVLTKLGVGSQLAAVAAARAAGWLDA
jgi:DNA-binding NarL/FixJ family response regulator